MQVKGLFLNYKKNRRLMQYFFKIRAGIMKEFKMHRIQDSPMCPVHYR